MIWTEGNITHAIATQVLQNRCLLLLNNCMWTGHECDVLGVTMDLRIIDIEVKISRADFKADAAKEKWWHRPWNFRFVDATGGYAQAGPPAPDQRRLWPKRVWKHYMACPKEILKPELLLHLPSKMSGVILLDERRGGFVRAEVLKRATPNRQADRLEPADVMDIARLQNMRMWQAYAQRDAAKALAREVTP